MSAPFGDTSSGPAPAAPGIPPGVPAVEAAGFVKRYGKVEAVRGLDLAVAQGELFGLIGPDGAGKSSLLKAVAGVLSYEGGEVRVFGLPVTTEAGAEAAKAHLGFMPQGLGRNLYGDLSIEENIDFFAKLRLVPAADLRERKERLLGMTRLDRFRARPMKQLSGGMKQKLGLVCTLIHAPRLILLDEPTTGVDPVSRRDFWTILHELLSEGGVTALISTAYMDEASRFDRVALLYQGRALAVGPAREVAAGTPGVVLRIRPEVVGPGEIRVASSVGLSADRGGLAAAEEPGAQASSVSSAATVPRAFEAPDALELLGARYASVRGLGREVRVFVPGAADEGAATAALHALLGGAGIGFSITGREAADLEDVFVCKVAPHHADAPGGTGGPGGTDTPATSDTPELSGLDWTRDGGAPITPIISGASGEPARQADEAQGLAIHARGLIRDFGSFRAVDNVSFSVKPGEIFGLLGANGAGKTTVIKMLTGILSPTGGAGSVAGADMLRGGRAIKERIGYMSQAFSLYTDLTVAENLRLYAGVYGLNRRLAAERVVWAIKLAGLAGRENALTASLPMGLSQRLALCCALLHRPRILFLDEPTSGVDPLGRRLFWDILRRLSRRAGVAVLITTHYMSEAEYCDHLALMYAGRVVADATPEAMKAALLADAGPMLEVDVDDPHRAVAALRAAGFAEAALHGGSVHAQAGPGEARERGAAVAAALVAAGVNVRAVAQTPLSMEDVFVHRVLALEAEEAGAKGARA